MTWYSTHAGSVIGAKLVGVDSNNVPSYYAPSDLVAGVELTANKGQASGYASLNSSAKLALAALDPGSATSGQVMTWGGAAWGPVSPPTAVTPTSASSRTTLADTDLIPWYDSVGNDYVVLPTTLVSYILGKVDSPVAVTFAATVTLNCLNGFARNFEVGALTSAVTIANPTNLVNGQTISIRLPQDGTGGRVATWGSMFRFTGGAKTLSTAASAVDRFVGSYSSATGLIEGTLLLGIA